MREPDFWWSDSALGALLSPLGTLYGAITAARMRQDGAHAAVPVVCVGNLTLGGTGKTPTAIAIARHLAANGERPVMLTRGYGGRESGPLLVDGHAGADAVGDDADDDLVRDQPARVHHGLGLLADRRAGGDGCAQHVAGGKLRNAVLRDDARRLSAFTRPRRPQENQPHLRASTPF